MIGQLYKTHVDSCFELALKGVSKITPDIIAMDGMTGTLTRHLYNNMLNMPDARYLEIGTWKGSSVCSAMCGNRATVTCIDNWSEFGGPKQEFLVNFAKFKGENTAAFIEADCFKVNVDMLPKFNVYMYDGNHTQDSHQKALLHYYAALDDVFILIVDDWNWQEVRDGTQEAIEALNCKVLYQKEVRLTFDNSHTPMTDAAATWWNGVYVAVLQKRTVNYTINWFNPGYFKILDGYTGKDNVHFLEIGSFQGMGTNYFIDHFLTGTNCFITCVDPWIKYSESTVTHMSEWDNVINNETYDLFLKNTSYNRDKIIVQRGLSTDIVPQLTQQFDFVYIDGDHSEKTVWLDAIHSFEKLAVNGIMIFDDYTWGQGECSPEQAINKFMQEYAPYLQVLAVNYQVSVRKIADKL